MAKLCVLILVAALLFPATALYDHRAELVAQDGGTHLAITSAGLGRIIVFAVNILFLIPFLWGVLQLRQLFILYAEGEIFSRPAARHLSRFALAWLISAFASILSQFARNAVLTAFDPGHRAMFQINGGHLSAVFGGLIFLVIAWVLNEAATVAEEHRGFV